MNTDIYFDESGHTGSDLLNKEQPIFTLAASWMNDSDYEELAKLIPGSSLGKEYKFSSLRKRKSHPKILSDLIGFLAERNDLYCAYVVHKKSILIEKFVLDCIEPMFSQCDYDMSEKGGTRSYANLLNACLPAFMGESWYDSFLQLYQSFYRQKSSSALSELVNHCNQLSDSVRELLDPFILAPELSLDEVLHPAYKTQIFDPVVYGLIIHIRHAFSISNMNIFYDQTKATTTPELKITLETLHNHTDQIKVSDICTVHPDIQITGVSSCDSKKEPLIQISDLIAGLYTYCAKNLLDNPDDPLCIQLMNSCNERNLIHKFCNHDITPEELGTTGSNSSISTHAYQGTRKG